MLGDVPRQAGDLARQHLECAPTARGELPLGIGECRDLLGHAPCVPAVGEPREPLQIRVGKAERLPHVADRAARPVGGEAGDERGMFAPVALGHGDDQLFADVAREVEIDVRDGLELAIEEAAERKVVLDGIDVRETGEVADDRADGAASAAAGGKEAPGGALAAYLECNRAGELEHLPVEQEEAGQAELVDQRQLALEAGARLRLQLVGTRPVALRECVRADLGELPDGGIRPVREVGVAVAELLRQVELQPLRDHPGSLCCSPVDAREELDHLAGRAKEALAVAATLLLAAVERRPAANGDEDVLQQRSRAVVGVDVPGRDRLDAEVRRQVGQERVAARVASLERPLQLDVEALPSEGLGEPGSPVRVAYPEPLARTAGETDEPLVQLGHRLPRDRRRQGLTILPAGTPCPGMRLGEDAAEVGVTALALAEQRHVSLALEHR